MKKLTKRPNFLTKSWKRMKFARLMKFQRITTREEFSIKKLKMMNRKTCKHFKKKRSDMFRKN